MQGGLPEGGLCPLHPGLLGPGPSPSREADGRGEGRGALLAPASSKHPPSASVSRSALHCQFGGSPVSLRCSEAVDPAIQAGDERLPAQGPGHGGTAVPGAEPLTRPPTQEPHAVAPAGVAPVVVAHKPIILASFVHNLGGEVDSIHGRGLGTARKLQSKVILFGTEER